MSSAELAKIVVKATERSFFQKLYQTIYVDYHNSLDRSISNSRAAGRVNRLFLLGPQRGYHVDNNSVSTSRLSHVDKQLAILRRLPCRAQPRFGSSCGPQVSIVRAPGDGPHPCWPGALIAKRGGTYLNTKNWPWMIFNVSPARTPGNRARCACVVLPAGRPATWFCQGGTPRCAARHSASLGLSSQALSTAAPLFRLHSRQVSLTLSWMWPAELSKRSTLNCWVSFGW